MPDTVPTYNINPNGYRRPDGDETIGAFQQVDLPEPVFRPLAQDPRMMSVAHYNDEYLSGLDYASLQQHARLRRKHTGEEINAKQSRDDLIDTLRLDVGG